MFKKKVKPREKRELRYIRYIQRGIQTDNNLDKKGIDQIVRFEYMGASEYEWGALPKALEFIRENMKYYDYTVVMLKGKTYQVFSDIDNTEDTVNYLNAAYEASKEYKIKQGGGRFAKYADGKPGKFDDSNFWWDIENHVMWWEDNESFLVEFKNLIKV